MTRAPGGWSRVGGSVPHFLDSLACLFFGGAHFKHIVSTESETRETQSHPTLANQLRGKTRHENPGDLRAWRHVCNKVRRFLEHLCRYLWLVVSCTGRSSGAPPPVWASHRWRADLSSTSPCWATAACWWCHSVWCWSSGWETQTDTKVKIRDGCEFVF